MTRPTFRDPQPPSVAQTLVSPPTGATLPLNQLAPEAALTGADDRASSGGFPAR